MMTKKLVKLTQLFPKTVYNGPYDVKFYDGIDLPFNVGPERWRTIEGKGYISFDNLQNDSVKKLSFDLINHPLEQDVKSSAYIQLYVNDKKLLKQRRILAVDERKTLDVKVPHHLLMDYNNKLIIDVTFNKKMVLEKKSQILGLINLQINDQVVNKESIDVPYVSELSQSITRVTYHNWGAKNRDPWRLWELHTQVYERTPDFWWLRPLYYWDLPKGVFSLLLILNISGITIFGLKTLSTKPNA